MLKGAVADPGLLALYGIGACCMGAFVGVYNVMGFRLTAAPFGLSVAAAGLVFLVYAIGTVSSAIAGRLAERFSRRAVVPAGCLITAAGVLLTLPASLPCIAVGLAVMTAGFFAVHGVASSWVPVRAHAGGVASAQAASLYLFAYYLGSSVFGNLAGHAWTIGGWPAVVAAVPRPGRHLRAAGGLAPAHPGAGRRPTLTALPDHGSGRSEQAEFGALGIGHHRDRALVVDVDLARPVAAERADPGQRGGQIAVRRSRWIRVLPTFGSGTGWNVRAGPPGTAGAARAQPGSGSSSRSSPRSRRQNSATTPTFPQSMVTSIHSIAGSRPSVPFAWYVTTKRMVSRHRVDRP